MNRFSPLLWTLAILAVLDVGINVSTRYPSTPMLISSLGPFERYFNYGRSIESKVRWMVSDSDEASSPLARSGWLVRQRDRSKRAPQDREFRVAFYGMSFSNRIGKQLEGLGDRFSIRLNAGPGAAIGRSYADFLLDRGRYDADVVVLGVLASSVPATGTVTHMTWNFDAPGCHLYPRFEVKNSTLVRIDPPANSLREFRKLLQDEQEWERFVQFLEKYDPYYDEWAFRADVFDHSVLARLVRRAYAQARHRRVALEYHDENGFTDYDDNIEVARAIIEAFADQARADGDLPVVLLFNDRGYADDLYRAVHARMDELEIPYVSSHEVVRADELSKFEPDGHFRPEYDREIAQRLADLISERVAAFDRGEPGIR